MKVNKNAKGFVQIFSAQFGVLILGIISSFLIPLLLPVEEYANWQLFFLYAGYLGFFMFGFTDGIHLNYANKNYEKENFTVFRTLSKVALFLGVFGSMIIGIFSVFFLENEAQKFIFFMLSINMFFFSINGFSEHINQITMRFKFLSQALIMEKVIFTTILLIVLFLEFYDYKLLIIAFTCARAVIAIYNIYTLSEIFFGEGKAIIIMKDEIIANFKDGFYLMIAIILYSLILGSSRFFTERFFSITEFGIYSFAFSILAVTLQLIQALSKVFYPLLKRMSINTWQELNSWMNKLLTYYGAIILSSYFFVVLILNSFYLEYISMIEYLPYLFPIFIFISKHNLLILNFLKAQKKEKTILTFNFFAVILNVILAIGSYYIYGTIQALVISSMVGFIIFYYVSLLYLYSFNKWKVKLSVFIEFFYVSLFLVIAINLNIFSGLMTYLFVLLILFILNKKYIITDLRKLKKILVT